MRDKQAEDPVIDAETPIIELSDIRKSFGDLEVLRGIDLTVPRGAVVAILGRSGGGKSTLLRCINLLEVPTSGRISVGGRPTFTAQGPVRRGELVKLRRSVGMLFQSFNVFPHLSVIENVAMPLIYSAGHSESDAVKRAIDMLDVVGLREKAFAPPSQLSGGQSQRVALARALALDPLALLFDEPTSALDPESTADVLRVMKQLSEKGMTMVIVTHEIRFALGVAQKIVIMDEGVIVEEGTPREISTNAQHPRTRAFLADHLDIEQTQDPRSLEI